MAARVAVAYPVVAIDDLGWRANDLFAPRVRAEALTSSRGDERFSGSAHGVSSCRVLGRSGVAVPDPFGNRLIFRAQE